MKISEIRRSAVGRGYAAVLGAVFVLMLGCNLLTGYLADDFRYMFSFADWSRMERLSQILPSVAAHAKSMNGRLTAHTLVQLSLMLPPWVFDVVNALMCVGLVGAIEWLSRENQTPSPLLAAAVFCAIWVFLPAFGQVMLWQDGAINYLWSVCFALPLLHLTSRACLYDALPRTGWEKVGMLALSYLVGSYLESTSLAVLVCMALLLLVRRFYLKKPVSRWLFAALTVAAVGYAIIYLAPGQWQNKSGELSLISLINHVVAAVDRYRQFGGLAVVFVILLVICLTEKADMRRILLAGILVCGSLAANFVHVVAASYPERGTVAPVVLLLAADAVLLRLVLVNVRFRVLAVSLMAVMVLASVPALFSGTREIAVSYLRVRENEAHILQCREQGIADIEIKQIFTPSKYSPIYDLKYIDTEDAASWPNNSMARYYGVHSILGK